MDPDIRHQRIKELYKQFCGGQYFITHCHRRMSSHPSLLRSFLRMPVVYADSVPETSDVSLTTVSPLPEIKKRPQLMVMDAEIQAYIAQESGKDRIKALFQKDYKDQLHPDTALLLGVCKGVTYGSFIILSVVGAMNARQEFILKHRHVKFQTKFRAVRAYQDAIILGGLKTGFAVAVRALLFTSLFLTSAVCVSNYRNKTSPLEYVIGGAVAGSSLKWHMGPKGMVAGGLVGSALGLVGGTVLSVVMHVAGETQEVKHARKIEQYLIDKKEAQLLADGSIQGVDTTTMHLVHKQT